MQQAFEQIPKQKAEQREHAQSIAEIHQPAKGEIYISGHSQQDDGKQKKGNGNFAPVSFFKIAWRITIHAAKPSSKARLAAWAPIQRIVRCRQATLTAAAANVETITTLVRLSELKIYPKKPE